jgi:hypothetical protein
MITMKAKATSDFGSLVSGAMTFGVPDITPIFHPNETVKPLDVGDAHNRDDTFNIRTMSEYPVLYERADRYEIASA